jgi:hypothetical protein
MVTMARFRISDFGLRISRWLAACNQQSAIRNRQSEAGFAMAYVALVLAFVALPLSFVASDLVRLAWARSEMQKAADAAAEAGAQMADIAAWKNAGVVQLLPGASAEAANVAAMNSAGLATKNIHPSITYIVVDESTNTVRVGMRAQVRVTLLSVLFPQLSVSTEGTSQLRLGNLH